MWILYEWGIRLYGLGILLAGRFSHKALLWINGRKDWSHRLRAAVATEGLPWVWIHCASLGEFEQGRNLIDTLYDEHPGFRILVTFFSPSGYEIRKNYAKAHHVAYLPLDTAANARVFLQTVSPAFGIFIKYELWMNHLREARRLAIPLILVAARPHPEKWSFKWPAQRLFREAYLSFQHIFTQDEASHIFLAKLGHPSLSVSSDTRFDRVSSNRDNWQEVPGIAAFLRGRTCLVAGSTWPKEEDLLLRAWSTLPEDLRPCLIIAPHEIHLAHIQTQINALPKQSLCYSNIDSLSLTHEILWIDQIGLLSRLYAYGSMAYVGGAFDKGLHNVLEAAVYGCNLLIGPRYQRFPEAVELVKLGACQSIDSTESLREAIEGICRNHELREKRSRTLIRYVEDRTGATLSVISWLKKTGWLG